MNFFFDKVMMNNLVAEKREKANYWTWEGGRSRLKRNKTGQKEKKQGEKR